jgi:hypothetical protein
LIEAGAGAYKSKSSATMVRRAAESPGLADAMLPA